MVVVALGAVDFVIVIDIAPVEDAIGEVIVQGGVDTHQDEGVLEGPTPDFGLLLDCARGGAVDVVFTLEVNDLDFASPAGSRVFFREKEPKDSIGCPAGVGEAEGVQEWINAVGVAGAACPSFIETVPRLLLVIGHIAGEDIFGQFHARSAKPFYISLGLGVARENSFHLHVDGEGGG